MTIELKGFPFDSIGTGEMKDGFPVHDRPYGAEELRAINSALISNGVTQNGFGVAYKDSRSVEVQPGLCCMQGAFGWLREPTVLDIEPSWTNSMCSVVLRWDNTKAERKVSLRIEPSTMAGSSGGFSAYQLVRNEEIWELRLAYITTTQQGTISSASSIRDVRLEDSECGIIKAVAQIDTADYLRQLEAMVDEAANAYDEALSGTVANQVIETANNALAVANTVSNGLKNATSDIATLQTKTDPLKNYIYIENNKNLNDMTEIGRLYRCGTNATAATLANCPTGGIAFWMMVQSIASDSTSIYRTQIVFPYSQTVFYIRQKGEGGSWTGWADFNWAEIKSATNYASSTTFASSGKIILERYGRVCVMTFNAHPQTVAAGAAGVSLGTLPAAWRPIGYTYGPMIDNGVYIAVNQAGAVTVTNRGSSSISSIIGQIVYILNS